jgi:hypothetical protein
MVSDVFLNHFLLSSNLYTKHVSLVSPPVSSAGYPSIPLTPTTANQLSCQTPYCQDQILSVHKSIQVTIQIKFLELI